MTKTLEAVLQDMDRQEDEVVQQPFMVEDMDSAAEAQRRITYFNEQMAEINAVAEKQMQPFLDKIEKIKAWAEENKQEYVEKIEHYEALLGNYIHEEVQKQIASGKKPKKTIKLPYGQIKLQKQQPEFKKDEEKLLQHAKELGYYKTEESVDWAELKKKASIQNGKMFDENGEEIPGVEVTEREDKFVHKLD